MHLSTDVGISWRKSDITCSRPAIVSHCLNSSGGLCGSPYCLGRFTAVASRLVFCCLLKSAVTDAPSDLVLYCPGPRLIKRFDVHWVIPLQDDLSDSNRSSSTVSQLSSRIASAFIRLRSKNHRGLGMPVLRPSWYWICVTGPLSHDFYNCNWAASSSCRKFCISICNASSSNLWSAVVCIHLSSATSHLATTISTPDLIEPDMSFATPCTSQT